jgi:hypothetical protein
MPRGLSSLHLPCGTGLVLVRSFQPEPWAVGVSDSGSEQGSFCYCDNLLPFLSAMFLTAPAPSPSVPVPVPVSAASTAASSSSSPALFVAVPVGDNSPSEEKARPHAPAATAAPAFPSGDSARPPSTHSRRYTLTRGLLRKNSRQLPRNHPAASPSPTTTLRGPEASLEHANTFGADDTHSSAAECPPPRHANAVDHRHSHVPPTGTNNLPPLSHNQSTARPTANMHQVRLHRNAHGTDTNTSADILAVAPNDGR